MTADAKVRQRLARQLSGVGAVLMVSDFDELQAVLCPADRRLGNASPVRPAASSSSELLIDRGEHRVSWQGRSLALTPLELEVLGTLASPPLAVWTYERLYAAAWGGSYLGDASTVHAAVTRLRRKLRAAGDGTLIETVRGVGYRLAFSSGSAVTIVD
ncbi:MAG TPA: winged helix-turn-helix domain-containing protein [Micromonosporaceae bacterium]|nr:winged helix-turn-helix domain-containing protein [Micromonosporaceae bacterium]